MLLKGRMFTLRGLCDCLRGKSEVLAFFPCLSQRWQVSTWHGCVWGRPCRVRQTERCRKTTEGPHDCHSLGSCIVKSFVTFLSVTFDIHAHYCCGWSGRNKLFLSILFWYGDVCSFFRVDSHWYLHIINGWGASQGIFPSMLCFGLPVKTSFSSRLGFYYIVMNGHGWHEMV